MRLEAGLVGLPRDSLFSVLLGFDNARQYVVTRESQQPYDPSHRLPLRETYGPID